MVVTDFDNVTCFSDHLGLNTAYLININLDDDISQDGNPETIIPIRLMACCNRYKQHKACKKDISKELMPVAWHTTR